ncbi:MAG TPA: phosphate/phosphite/phosphonate ABC transporter substrate-binding protein, partial [Variovorax sp.]
MNVSRILTGLGCALGLAAGAAHAQSNCPNGGVVRFGVEPYESAQRLIPVYKDVAKLIGDKLGCTVELYVATSY